jgi:riboflavin synthase
MFTGIVRGIGHVVACSGDRTRRLSIETGRLATSGWRIGDSVSVSGVCLTIVELADRRFDAELSGETLMRTTLDRLAPGASVNLEPALADLDAIGGHFVTGHVDGIARAIAVEESAGSLGASIEAPLALARFIARKGSVALDGVSLTVAEIDGAAFRIDIVPHTRVTTTLGQLAPGQALNLEIDLIARYLERLLEARKEP